MADSLNQRVVKRLGRERAARGLVDGGVPLLMRLATRVS